MRSSSRFVRPHHHPTNPPARPASRLGIAPAALRVVVLFSDVVTISQITLVSRELRDAFSMAKDEMLPALLRLRSIRAAKVLAHYQRFTSRERTLRGGGGACRP